MLGLFKKKTEQAVEKSRTNWFGKVTRLFEKKIIDEETWEQLEELLIGADVGAETAGKLVSSVKARSQKQHLGDSAAVRQALKDDMVRLLQTPRATPSDGAGPQVTVVVGVNGSGKTTSIAKLAHMYREAGKKVLLVAADTFRAAAIEQLQMWAQRMEVDIIVGKPGSDPGAVVYDALHAARSRNVDVVIIDTAGRLHTKFNLMEELKKIKRIASKEASGDISVVLVLDATTGQNGLAQARHFSEAVDLTGIILSKLDGTARGGIVFAITDQLRVPIQFIGTGEGADDLAPFDPESFVEALFAGEQGMSSENSGSKS